MTHRFTVKFIENLKAKDKPYQEREGKGFGIRVFPSGEKRWVFAYKLHDRQRTMTLGSYPELKLEDARKMFFDARSAVAKGNDPLDERKTEKGEPTFKIVLDEYLSKVEKELRSFPEVERILKKYPPKSWAHQKIKTISRKMIKECIDRIAVNAPAMSGQVQKKIKQLFSFAVDQDYIEYNPCDKLRPIPQGNTRERYLKDDEIKKFYIMTESAGMSDSVKRALWLALLTAQRIGEIVGMRHEEIEGGWWTIPIARSKNKMSHRVYLTDTALQLIGKGEGIVFPSPHKLRSEKSIVVKSVNAAVRNNDYFGIEAWTPHDLRRTAASHMTLLGISRFDVGIVLNHSDKSVTAVYDRNSYDKEKKKALILWERRLLKLQQAEISKVISIAG